ncbi:B-cell receptor CD22-like [Centropristis striata]|uniref:B-cell receptor CD22-like n=1 Tax=Centropristis striata TaxID=184440 RepID=UPI0027DEB635|nr:B-cell receptor CD22-like [Centropristis striata]
MTSTNSGNYTCSLKTHTATTSGVLNIDVEYGPKNTSVRRWMEAYAGSNISLICSSHANPPVENYTWFKIDGDAIRDVGHQPVFFPGDGGHYLCSATNKHGSQNSSVVTLKIQTNWATFTRDVLIIAAVLLVIVIIVIAVRRLHKKRMWTPRTEEDSQDTDYVNWLPCEQLQEEPQCEGGATEVIYTTVHFNNKRESNMGQQMDPRTEVIYISVCRDQQSNPSHIEPP